MACELARQCVELRVAQVREESRAQPGERGTAGGEGADAEPEPADAQGAGDQLLVRARAVVRCACRNVMRCPTRSARRMRRGSWRLNHAQVVELMPPGNGRLPTSRRCRALPIVRSSSRATSTLRRSWCVMTGVIARPCL